MALNGGGTGTAASRPAVLELTGAGAGVPNTVGSGGDVVPLYMHRTSSGGGAAAAAVAAAASAGPAGGPSSVSSKNDYFQFSTHEGLGVGGAGGFAIWLDNDLLEGSSAPCGTFNSPCLASRAEFSVASVELWVLHG